MHIRVLLFGPAALAQGEGAVRLELEEAPSYPTKAVLDALESQYNHLAPFTQSGRLAINGKYATDEVSLSPDDEIALIAMVSGG